MEPSSRWASCWRRGCWFASLHEALFLARQPLSIEHTCPAGALAPDRHHRLQLRGSGGRGGLQSMQEDGPFGCVVLQGRGQRPWLLGRCDRPGRNADVCASAGGNPEALRIDASGGRSRSPSARDPGWACGGMPTGRPDAGEGASQERCRHRLESGGAADSARQAADHAPVLLGLAGLAGAALLAVGARSAVPRRGDRWSAQCSSNGTQCYTETGSLYLEDLAFFRAARYCRMYSRMYSRFSATSFFVRVALLALARLHCARRNFGSL
jgi:hypothetical protein